MSGFDVRRFDPPLTVPTIASGPVLLRPFEADDLTLIQTASMDGDIVHATSIAAASSATDALGFIERQHALAHDGHGYSFAIALVEDERHAVGGAGLWLGDIESRKASVGYWLSASHRGSRRASSALRGLVQFAFEGLAIPRMEAHIEQGNISSIGTAIAVGFTLERATARRVGPDDASGEETDCYVLLQPAH